VVVWASDIVELPSNDTAKRKAPEAREKIFIAKKPPKNANDLRDGVL
jgi:hypothetical protein